MDNENNIEMTLSLIHISALEGVLIKAYDNSLNISGYNQEKALH